MDRFRVSPEVDRALSLLTKGYRYKEIAEKLGLEHQTMSSKLRLAKKTNECETTYQLLAEYIRSRT